MLQRASCGARVLCRAGAASWACAAVRTVDYSSSRGSAGRATEDSVGQVSGIAPLWGTQVRHYAASAKNVKAVREQTGLAMKVCRQALEESGDDVTAALAWIEANAAARGEKAQAKLGDRATAEGRIAVEVEGSTAGLAEIGCETDFVARTDDVDALVKRLALAALATKPTKQGETPIDVDSLLAGAGMGSTLADDVKAAISSVGENIIVRRAATFSGGDGVQLGTYTHGIGTYVAVVGLQGGSGGVSEDFANKLAQQIVAVDPGDGGVDDLLSAPYLFNGDTTVREALEAEAKGATVTGYLRWANAKMEGS